MIDLTVLLLPTAWSDSHLSRSLASVLTLMRDSGLRVHCLIAEFLPASTDLQRQRDTTLAPLPPCLREVLALDGFDYVVEFAHSARALRRVVRCARGRYVVLLREGDELGFRVGADQALAGDSHDVLLALSAEAGASLAAHQALASLAGDAIVTTVEGRTVQPLAAADAPVPLRALPALVRLLTAYDGALVARRDFLDDALGLTPYDGTPAFLTFVNEVLALHALRGPSRVGFTQQLAAFPHPEHARQHRVRVGQMLLPLLLVRRSEGAAQRGHPHEPHTEALVDAVLSRLCTLFSAQPGGSAGNDDPAAVFAGELTRELDTELRRCAAQIQRGWGWSAAGHAVPAPGLHRAPRGGAPAPPQVSLICSAFRGQAVVHSFVSDLVRQTAWDRCELIVVLPELNLVQDLVFEAMALALPALRLLPLAADPGIYGCWNLGVRAARGQYISNANLDDRRDATHVERLASWLDDTGADVASAAVAITHVLTDITRFDGKAGETAAAQQLEVWYDGPAVPAERDLRDLFAFNAQGEVIQCMNFPHCMPMWQRSLHDRFGAFDEARHGTYADFAFWLRAASSGARFVHSGQVLGLYLVDPKSHNRRHSRHATWQELVLSYLPADTVVHTPTHVAVVERPAKEPAVHGGRVERDPLRLNFGDQISQNYGNHRSGWAYAVQALREFDDPTAPVFCNTFIEKRFVWGGDAGDGGVGPITPHLQPWVGFLHVPPLVPAWFQFEQSNEQIFSKEAWHKSLPNCRGLFVLTDYHRRHLQATLRPDFPISVLHHPTEFPSLPFDLERFHANQNKRLVQIGWWLRKLAAIDRLQVPGYTPTLLGSSDWSKNLIAYAERRYHGLIEPGRADVIDFLGNDAYDALLTENIVFIDFYDTSANNAVIECIARGTPILVCRHPAVEEYLGREYPMFYTHYAQIAPMLTDAGRIRAAHQHLLQAELRERLTLEHFKRAFAQSEVARNAS